MEKEEKKERKKKRFKLKLPSIKNVLTIIIGILVVYFGISFATNLMNTNMSGESIVLYTLELRSSGAGLIEKSRLITNLDELIQDTSNKNIKDSWTALSPCLSNKCHDLQYMVFIEQVIQEESMNDQGIILSLIQAWKNWGGNDLIKFSRAITDIDEELQEAPQTIYKKWQEIVSCDGKCMSMNDLFFEIIELILKKDN